MTRSICNLIALTYLFLNLCLLFCKEVKLADGKECASRDFGYGSFVCVCNETYCDSLPPIESPVLGQIIQVESNKASKRWMSTSHKFKLRTLNIITENEDVIVKINKGKQFQKILGFGGAFTDATGINIKSLPKKIRKMVMRGYFSAEGLEYNLGRVPIGGSDFSTHPYTYDDLSNGQVDPNLEHFSLVKEDFIYKIPFMQEAKKLAAERGVSVKFYCSPWSGPAWMKDNRKINGKGKLLKKYYSTWASYFVRFLKEYEKHNISFYGLTTQNEPTAGLFANYPFNAMGWMPEEQAEWIGKHLGPQLHESGYENLTIFMLDDQRLFLPSWIKKIMVNKLASKYVGGIAVHWYDDFLASANLLDLTHEYFPHLPILYTEACSGWAPWDLLKVVPGSWTRAENYARDIIENLQHWVVGWTDWNLALDLRGGPNWVENFVDSPIIVNQSEKEFFRQPMFYTLAHFSKILPEGSVRIDGKIYGKRKSDIFLTTFMRPDQSLAMIVLNRNRFPMSIKIIDSRRSFNTVLDPSSITSFVWKI